MYDKRRRKGRADFAFEHGNVARSRQNCGFFADFALILKQKFNLQIGAEKCFMAMFGGSPLPNFGRPTVKAYGGKSGTANSRAYEIRSALRVHPNKVGRYGVALLDSSRFLVGLYVMVNGFSVSPRGVPSGNRVRYQVLNVRTWWQLIRVSRVIDHLSEYLAWWLGFAVRVLGYAGCSGV